MSEEHGAALILVVDDRDSNLQIVGQLLETAGYHAMPAMSGEQALARAQARPPDLVLLDLLMPKMNGVETCKRLRALPRLADVPIIFLTASAERESLSEAFAAGAVDYVTKPFVPEELLARVKTHVDLKRARDHLARMLKEREDITDVVAHDLKNPLANIRFAVQLIERKPDDGPRVRELVRDIANSAEEGLQFIQRFLARRAEGESLRQLSNVEVDLRRLAQEAVQLQKSSAEARGIVLSVEGEPAPAVADPLATRNVLQNLISNAIRHSVSGQEISVATAAWRPGFSRCLVMDRGPGISESDQQRLFKRFVRLGSAPGGNEYSSGLGLAIARHDLIRMGGNLWYEARSGGGSVFGFELPQHRETTG